jgi:hypothetical protein
VAASFLRRISICDGATTNFGKPPVAIHTAFKSAATFIATSFVDALPSKTNRFSLFGALSP